MAGSRLMAETVTSRAREVINWPRSPTPWYCADVLHAGNRGGKVKAVRVMVAHSSEAVCEALTKVVEADPRVAVVASATSGEEIIRKATITWPTVVVMDIAFPDMGAG